MKIHIFLFTAKRPSHGGSGDIAFDEEDAMEQLVRNTHEKSVAWPRVANFSKISSVPHYRIRKVPLRYSCGVKFKENVNMWCSYTSVCQTIRSPVVRFRHLANFSSMAQKGDSPDSIIRNSMVFDGTFALGSRRASTRVASQFRCATPDADIMPLILARYLHLWCGKLSFPFTGRSTSQAERANY
jgi:hypothetical protein